MSNPVCGTISERWLCAKDDPSETVAICRSTRAACDGRRARLVGFILLLALVGLSTGIRVRSYLLTRRIQAVLAGLQQLKVDTTTEEELARTVPYLVREAYERREGTHLLRYYQAAVSNEKDYRWLRSVPRFVFELWPSKFGEGGVTDKWNAMDGSLKAAYILGWRNLPFPPL